MSYNLKLTCSYDGTRYHGWQKADAGPSIEEELSQALETILQHKVRLSAASRTDRGVHALGQVVSFQAVKIPALASLNKLLPQDIRVVDIKIANTDFHATLSAKRKIYRYRLTNATFQMPHERLYQWHYPYSLDLSLMKKGIPYLVGEHDFETLTNHREDKTYESTIRKIDSITIEEVRKNEFEIYVKGKSFLYKMVRNLVGLLLFVGRGRIKPEDIPAILASKDRKTAGVSAAACGLTLICQEFDEKNECEATDKK